MQVKSLDNGHDIYGVEVPLKLSILKPIRVKWIIELHDYLRNNTEMICKGFEQAGINEAITLELEEEDPFADLD